jgi:hypothetical protein
VRTSGAHAVGIAPSGRLLPCGRRLRPDACYATDPSASIAGWTVAFVISAACAGRLLSTDSDRREPAPRRSDEGSRLGRSLLAPSTRRRSRPPAHPSVAKRASGCQPPRHERSSVAPAVADRDGVTEMHQIRSRCRPPMGDRSCQDAAASGSRSRAGETAGCS